MKLLVTGKTGQVGWELQQTLGQLGEVIAVDRTQLDLSQPAHLARTIQATRPDVIVNAAAYTAVDQAEAETDLAATVNAVAPGVLAEEGRKIGALLIHYSTDYVFDGTKPLPYTEEDAVNPLSVYGRTKLEGEQAIRASGCEHLILRTSWVFAPRGRNFLLTILRLSKERPVLRIVNDQIGAPTSASEIARATLEILRRRKAGQSGVYHLTTTGYTSWHGFASLIVSLLPPPHPEVQPITTSDYPTAAQRPLNSRLDCSKLEADFGLRLPNWQEATRAVMRCVPGQS